MNGLLGERRAMRAGVAAILVAAAAIGVGGEHGVHAGGSDVPLAVAGPPSVIVPLEPARILDTRLGIGVPAGAVGPGSTITLQVTGAGGVPSGATGVVLNLTATQADGAGYVTAYPGGGTRPVASVINYSAGEDVANMLTAQLAASGALDIFNDQANVHLIADVAGYLVPGNGAPGPAGPQGPAGPRGPGARVIVNHPVGVEAGDVVIGTFAGFELSAFCLGGGTVGVRFDALADGPISVVGVKEIFLGSPPEFIDLTSASGEQQVVSSFFMQLSAVVDAAGTLSSVELGMVQTPSCRVWGTITPGS